MAILVIGYGNTLRRDDGVGPFVAERLAADFAGRGDVEVMVRHMLTPELSESMSRATLVVLIDASAELAAGEVRVERIEPGGALPQSLVHHLTPRALGALAQVLYGACPPMTLISIGVEDMDHGEGLSPAAQRGAEEAVEKARRVVNEEERNVE